MTNPPGGSVPWAAPHWGEERWDSMNKKHKEKQTPHHHLNLIWSPGMAAFLCLFSLLKCAPSPWQNKTSHSITDPVKTLPRGLRLVFMCAKHVRADLLRAQRRMSHLADVSCAAFPDSSLSQQIYLVFKSSHIAVIANMSWWIAANALDWSLQFLFRVTHQ